MRNVRQLSISRSRHGFLSVLPLAAAMALGCQGKVGPSQSGTAGSGSPGMGGGSGNPAGVGGAAGMAEPCTGPSDPRMVPATQRILRLTSPELVNTIRFLFNEAAANAVVMSGNFGNELQEEQRQFPPLQENSINAGNYQTLENVATVVREYVTANFTTLASCTNPSDSCATTYLNGLAARAYRRQLTSAEQTRFTALYNRLRNQTVQGCACTSTVQEATGWSVQALLMSPQVLWRSEIGNPAMASTSPAGIPLTDNELATHLSFFLTDQPPDDMLRSAAAAGTLRANLGQHVDRLLNTQVTKDWLRTILEAYYKINKINEVPVDTDLFPIWTPALISDMRTEARMFLDRVLWQGNLTDLFLSRTTFVNGGLAQNIYKIPVPGGATATSFVETTLPADQRAGILTNAGFLASRARSDGLGLVIPRGRVVAAAILCVPPDPPPDTIAAAVEAAKEQFAHQTAQQQVASRQAIPLCASCHAQFDPYGLALEYYDNLGVYRTTDHLNMPVDGTTPLPPILGGGTVANAIQLAETLAASPAFTACMASTMLQYAMVQTADGAVPLPSKGGCAAGDVVARYDGGSSKTFAALIRAVTQTPAFVLRKAVQ